jgi:zinc protease
MRASSLLFGLLAFCLAFTALAQDTQADNDQIFTIPYEMRTLDNGLKVIVVPTDYPDVVSIQIPVQTGSRNEVEDGKSGFAHFFEHMMFRGTENFPPAVYGEMLKKAGADQNAYTTDDYTNYHITFTKDDLETVIQLEADRFQNLSYSESQFRTEALAVKGEYLKNYSNPIQKVLERVREMAFKAHTYGHTTMGFFKDIEAMPDQFDYSRTFFDRFYRPEKSAVILVGDLEAERAFELVEQYWGDWERGNYEADIPVEPAPSGPQYEHIAWEGPTQPWLLAAYRGPAFDAGEKSLPALELAGQIYFGQTSELYKQLVVDEQWADSVFAWFPQRKDPQLLYIGVRLNDAEHAEAAYAAINDTIARMRTETVDAAQLERLKSRMRYQFANSLDSSTAIAETLASYVQYERDPEIINRYYATVESITPEDLRLAADTYFVDQGRTMITLDDTESMPGISGEESVDALAAVRAQAPAMADVDLVAEPLDASSLVNVSLVFDIGPAMDPAGKKGLAALTAAMITAGGSETMTISEINDRLFPMAAGFSAQVDKQMTRLAGSVHVDKLDDWYAIIRQQLLEPGFREADFDRLKRQQINAIESDLKSNNDEELGKEVLYADIYGPAHPYGSLNLGAVSDLEAITLEDVRAFYAEHFTQDNLTVGLAGGYPAEFQQQLLADLAALPRGDSELELPQPPAIDGRHAVVVEKETPAVAVSFGFPIDLVRGDEDWVALWLVRSWLGEHRSSNSYLYQRIREARGMNYGDYAYIEYFPRGMYRTSPNTNLVRDQQIFQVWIRPLRSNENAHFATRVAMYELDKLLEEGLSESAFENTRDFLAKQASLITAGQFRQLGYAIDAHHYDTPAFADYVRGELDKLTLEQVNAVLRKHLQLENMRFVFIAKDAEDLAERLRSDAESPIQYNSEQPEALLAEDEIIKTLPLNFDSVTVKPIADYFD